MRGRSRKSSVTAGFGADHPFYLSPFLKAEGKACGCAQELHEQPVCNRHKAAASRSVT